jgi:hypothetical protein
MFKWLSDWLMGKDLETNNVQVNPFPTTEKAPVNPQITDSVTQAAAAPAPAAKVKKAPATKKAADKKPTNKVVKPKATKKKSQA